jgi:hypothetical protein
MEDRPMTIATAAPLAPHQAAALLATMPTYPRALIEAAPRELLVWRPAPEEWCVDDLSRGGDHPEVRFLTVNDLLHEWIHHDANHLRRALANIQGYTWPNMGNAQRFSAPDSISVDQP